MPEEWGLIIDFLGKYPNFHFKASRISKELGISIMRLSKILLRMYEAGALERIEGGSPGCRGSRLKYSLPRNHI